MYAFIGSGLSVRRETTYNNQLRILIGLERDCQQMCWLVENEISPCYSGEYDICDVTLSMHPHRASWKGGNPDHGGNRNRDLWDTRSMLYQLSYVVKSVRVDDISELSLVPSI